MKTIKSWLIVALSILMMACCTMGLITVGASADLDPTLAGLQAINLTLDETQVRIGLEDDGLGGQKVTDYQENGIKYVVKMTKAEYEAISSDLGVVFGVLVLPKDYADENPVTYDNVFGENAVYAFDANDATKKQIVRIETDALALSDNGTETDESDDYYYYNVSMTNLKADNKDREFTAVPYLKSRDAEGVLFYDIKDVSKTESMTYLAQKKIEDSSTDADIIEVLQENYIDGLTAELELAIKTYYGDIEIPKTFDLEFALGTDLTVESIIEALETAGFDLDNYYVLEDDCSITVGGDEVDSAKVYANGKTGAEIEVLLEANEVDDEQLYEDVANYYKSETYQSIILTSDAEIILNPDFAYEGETTIGQFAIFADNHILFMVGEDAYLGAVEVYGEDFTLELGDDVHEYALATSYEVPASTYARIAGVYADAQNSTLIKLNADGTLLKDLKKAGSYLVAYNLGENEIQITFSSIEGDAYTSTLSYTETQGFAFSADTLALTSVGKEVASEDAYKEFAAKYVTQLHYRHDADLINAETGLPNSEAISAETYEGYITFNADGTLSYKGADQIAQKWYVWAGNGTALLQDVKIGNYVLYTDGSIKLHIPQFVNAASKSNQVILDNVILDAVYDETAGTVTVDYSDYRDWDTNVVYTTTASEVDLEELYAKFTAHTVDGENTKSTYSDYSGTWLPQDLIDDGKTSVQAFLLEFHSNKKLKLLDGLNTVTLDYELVPYSATFGEVVISGDYFDKVYYTRIGDIFQLRVSYAITWYSDAYGKSSLTTQSRGNAVAKGHFVDARNFWYNDSSSKPSLAQDAFKLLGGASELTYTGDGATLVLKNDGVNKIYREDNDKITFMGGKATFNGNPATYNVVAYDETSGKLFIDMAEYPVIYTGQEEIDATRFVEGEYYVKDGIVYTEFTYNDVEYKLSTAKKVELTTAQKLAGTYIGNQVDLVLNSDLTATLMEQPLTYSIEGNTITLSDGEYEEVGTFTIDGVNVKLDFGSVIYVKKMLTSAELYAKYAGTYTANYVANFEGKTVNATMSLVLDDQGNISATGTGDVEDYVRTVAGKEVALPMGHLGATANVGTYAFEIIDGELRIVLNFFVCSSSTDISIDSGYSSYNIYDNEGLPTTTAPSYSLGTNVPSVFIHTAAWKVYSYATGTAGEGMFDIVFQAYGDIAIHFEKVIAD